jgi:endonuclease YncB( thermonuclease family)
MRQVRLGKRKVSWLSLLLALFILVGQQYGWFGWLNQQVEGNQPGLYRVIKFDDGDTIAVDMNGQTETIRFIGVDTPETHDPRKPVQCYGPEAAAYTRATIGNQRVRLASDPLSSNRDRYDRLLRYVYLADGTLLNEQLIKTGHGFAYTYFPFTKSALFTKDEIVAQRNKIGVWKFCMPTANDFGGYTSNPRD